MSLSSLPQILFPTIYKIYFLLENYFFDFFALSGLEFFCNAFATETQPSHRTSGTENDFSEVLLPIIGCNCHQGGPKPWASQSLLSRAIPEQEFFSFTIINLSFYQVRY